MTSISPTNQRERVRDTPGSSGDACAFELVERQAQRTPFASAVVHEQECWSYRDLDRRANGIAHELRKLGVREGDLVAIFLPRTARMVAAVLGVHKAGAAYVPLDASYPAARTAFMLSDTSPRAVITERGLLPHFDGPTLTLDALDLDQPIPDAPPRAISPRNLSHVIYTSGSTGTPKGVAIEHHSVSALIRWCGTAFHAHELGGVVSWTSLCFDLSVFEIFAPLAHGGTVLLCEHLAYPDPAMQCAPRMLTTVPSLMRELLRAGSVPDSVVTVLLAGEPLTTAMADLVFARTRVSRVLDLYGPSECTTFSTCAERRRGDPATIGRPITGTASIVLDESGRPAPAGEVGELFLSGAGVAREYLGRPELTAERFVMMPNALGEVVRHYRTGDHVRERADGQLEFVGRKDSQVKVNGVRIELGEVEAAILATGLAQECVATLHVGDNGTPSIAAYVLRHQRAASVSATSIRQLLTQKLPRAMVPASITFVESFPLGATGKIDRSRLPSPAAHEGVAAAAPVDEIEDREDRVVALFARVLGHSDFTPESDFFDLGGTSLLALRLVEEVHREFGVRVPLAALVGGTCVTALAATVRDREQRPSAAGSLVAMRAAGTRAPLFLVHSAGGNVLAYRALVSRLPPDQPVFALQAAGLDGSTPALDRVEHMAALYVRQVREVQDRGPYQLGGSSVGGSIALEMARQLETAGEQVSLVAMFDTFPSRNALMVDRRGPLGRARSALKRVASGVWSADARRRIATQLRRTILRTHHSPARAGGRELNPMTAVALVTRGCRDAYVAYRPSRTSVRPTLLRATHVRPDGPELGDPLALWEAALPGRVNVIDVPGDHGSMLAEPHVEVLAQRLLELLATSNGE